MIYYTCAVRPAPIEMYANSIVVLIHFIQNFEISAWKPAKNVVFLLVFAQQMIGILELIDETGQ